MTNRSPRRKVAIVGDHSCGKTSLTLAFVHGRWSNVVWALSHAGNASREVVVDGRTFGLVFWDTITYEYDRLRPLTYMNAHIVLVCFSLTSPEPCDEVQKWVDEIDDLVPKTPFLLVGCKSDEKEGRRNPINSPEKGIDCAQMMGACRYLECPAKTGEGIGELLEAVVRNALHKPVAHILDKRKRFSGCIVA